VRDEQEGDVRKGKLFIFDGADGAGKTEAVAAVVALLRDDGYDVLSTTNPSDGQIGRFLRRMLAREVAVAGAHAKQLLFTADRFEHDELVVRPALERGQVVISDRYELSTAAYLAASFPLWRCSSCAWQGDDPPRRICDQCPSGILLVNAFNYVRRALAWNNAATRPAMTFLFDIPLDVCIQRMRGRSSSVEFFEATPFQQKVHAVFEALILKSQPKDPIEEALFEGDPLTKYPMQPVDANRSREDVAADLLARIRAMLAGDGGA
jgi:thymidylate kinase